MKTRSRRLAFLWTVFQCLQYGALAADRVPTVLPIRLAKLDQAEADRTVYREISKSNLLADKKDWGKLVILKWANKEYELAKKDGRKLDPEVMRTSLNQMIAKYNHDATLLDNPSAISTKGFDYAKLGLNAVKSISDDLSPIPGAGSASAVAAIGLEVARDFYVSSQGPKEQRRAQDSLMYITVQADSILNQAHENGMEEPAFREPLNATIGLDTRSFIGFPAQFNLDFNSKHQDGYRIENIDHTTKNIYDLLGKSIDKHGNLKIDYTKIEKIAADLQKDLAQQIDAGTDKVLGRINEIENKRAKSEYDASIKQLNFQAANSSVYLLAGIARIVDPESAQYIQATGSAAIQIASAIQAFDSTMNLKDVAGKALMGSINLVAGIGMAVEGIFSLLGGPSPDQMILEQIAKLGSQIAKLEEGMHARFDRIDRQLNAVMHAMSSGFEEVNRGIRITHINQEIMRACLNNLEMDLAKLNVQLYGYLTDLSKERINEDSDYCLSSSQLDFTDFDKCLKKFTTYATRHASNSLSSGQSNLATRVGSNNSDGVEHAYATLSKELEKGLWNNINVVGGFLAWRFSDYSLESGKSALPNLTDWVNYANDFAFFVSSHEEYSRTNAAEILAASKAIERSGLKLANALHALGVPKVSAEEQANTTFLNILSDYEAMSNSTEDEIKNHFRQFLITRTQSYNPFLSADAQPKKPNIDLHSTDRGVMRQCQNTPQIPNHPGPPPVLALPSDIDTLIPLNWRMAEDMKLGKISVCYEDVHWSDAKDMLHVYFKDELIEFAVRNKKSVDPTNGLDFERLIAKTRQFMTRDEAKHGHYWADLDTFRATPQISESQAFLERYVVPVGIRTFGKPSLFMHVSFNAEGGESVPIVSKFVQGKQATRYFGLIAITVENEGEMERRHTKNKAVWPLYKGYWAVFNAGNNGFGLSDQERGEPSLIHNELNKQWAGPESMAASITKSRTIDDRRTGFVRFTEQQIKDKALELVDLKLKSYRIALNEDLRKGIETGGPLKSNVESMSGAKSILKASIEYAYPDSIQGDGLRKFFYGGEHQLMDQSQFLMIGSDENIWDKQRTQFEANKGKLADLRIELERIARREPETENHLSLSLSLNRLEILHAAISSEQPKMSLVEAIENIKQTVLTAFGD